VPVEQDEPRLFASGAEYETYIGRWSRPVADRFVTWLSVGPGQRWLDVGCGTGALTDSILRLASPSEVTGIDQSMAFIDFARTHVMDGRASFEVADAQELPAHLSGFDVSVSGLVLNFIPGKEQALREMVRVSGPRRMVAAYVWDYAERMELMRYFWDVACELDARAEHYDEGQRETICHPNPLKLLFGRHLEHVEVEEITVPTVFRTFDDYWVPFLGAQGSAPSYVATLDEASRDGLREALRSRLPIETDGSIHLLARAWAVRGTSPA
jgi:trans-aconitate methyltransferase